MPYTSKAQGRAMHAAAEGKSNIGIPQKVGREYAAAGPASGNLPERKGKGKGKPGRGIQHLVDNAKSRMSAKMASMMSDEDEDDM